MRSPLQARSPQLSEPGLMFHVNRDHISHAAFMN
jgi:hypothetical protein